MSRSIRAFAVLSRIASACTTTIGGGPGVSAGGDDDASGGGGGGGGPDGGSGGGSSVHAALPPDPRVDAAPAGGHVDPGRLGALIVKVKARSGFAGVTPWDEAFDPHSGSPTSGERVRQAL